MNRLNLPLIALIVVCGFLSIADGRKIIDCYYDIIPRVYTEDTHVSLIKNIDPYLCTHISYKFFDIATETGEIKVSRSSLNDEQISHYVERTALLKERNPNLKIIFVVGDGAKADRIAADPAARENFTESAVKLIEKYNIDGLNLDWRDRPRLRNPENKEDLITLLTETHNAMKSVGKQFGITVFVEKKPNALVYDIPAIANSVDFINVNNLNLNITKSQYSDSSKRLKTLETNYLVLTIKYWLDQGVPASKLVLTLSFCKPAVALKDNKTLKRISQLSQGPIGKHLGFQTYCNMYDNKQRKTKEHKENLFQDNTGSIGLKAHLIKSLNLAGAMIWSIDVDDIKGICGKGKFPLLNAINKAVQRSK